MDWIEFGVSEKILIFIEIEKLIPILIPKILEFENQFGMPRKCQLLYLSKIFPKYEYSVSFFFRFGQLLKKSLGNNFEI